MKTTSHISCRAALCAALVASVALTSCETPGQTALLGAGTGAIIGHSRHGRGEDALKGAALGAGAGYIAGKVVQNQRRRAYDEGYRDAHGYPEERRGYYDRYGRWHRY